MPKFRKKSIVVEAIQYVPPIVPGTGNVDDLLTLAGGHDMIQPTQHWSTDGHPQQFVLIVKTLEGKTFADPGDWIIRGVEDEVYPCKPSIFEKTYERVVEVVVSKPCPDPGEQILSGPIIPMRMPAAEIMPRTPRAKRS